ncbi:baculoviral IAP repeat-containing protein 6 isoform X3 [Engraulis encrasicolus]|uniref:baculoviral IAP repeat-containing protein 6 isoform X3 n=1 Tax=Engraulis encrasicolus TaxID=184585 RepID=UPI002FD59555
MAAAASPGSCSSTSSDWVVLRDGCLRCDEEGLRSLSYHPALNAILAVTSRGSIKVIDGTSGAILQASALHAKPGGRVRCQYFPAVDKVLFVDDYAVGCRKDLNGILLLDTALQAPVSKPEDMVQLELPVTEAQQLLSACVEKVDVSNTEGYDLFLTQLKEGLKSTSHETAANHKVAKWATVTFHLPHHVIKVVASAIVNELKKMNQNVAALSVASSIMDRLSYLLPSGRPELGVGPGRSVDRSLMYSEANRRETFTSWPHAGYRWAQPDPMAQAGFYHQPASTGDDRAMCFTCSVCLVCWEPTDEPWSEHERHSPNCPFVKGEHTQNVPLSVTLATSPAQFPSPDGSDKIACYGFGSCPHFLAAATKRGKICIWDVSKLMKVHLKFEINPYDPVILRQLFLSSGEQGLGSESTESRRPTLAWLEDTSSCSDLPKLEGDSDDQLEDSDSEEHSRSESVTGHPCQKENLEVSLGVTALSVLQQPEKLQWEVVASVLEDTVKDLEELGANPALAQAKADNKAKDKPSAAEQHNIPFPCLLTGGLLSYRSAASSPLAGGPPPPPPSLAPTLTPTRGRPPPSSSSSSSSTLVGVPDGPLLRTQAPEVTPNTPIVVVGTPDQGPMEIESCPPPPVVVPPELVASPGGGGLPVSAIRRTIPVLLLYSIKEADEKASGSGKVFAQMNSLMGKSLHEEGFTVPQIIEMEFDSHEQLLLQDPPITYIQQFADATAGLGSGTGSGSGTGNNASVTDPGPEKWGSMAAPRPGALVQCLRLPKELEEENLYVDSITPCSDGLHLLVGLQPCSVESLSAINQVEALNNLNRLHSALCSRGNSRNKDDLHHHHHHHHPALVPTMANGIEGGHGALPLPGTSPPQQTPLILPPDQQPLLQPPLSPQQTPTSPSSRGVFGGVSTGGNNNNSSGGGGYLVLYKLNYSTRIVTLEEEPVRVQHIREPRDAVTSLILLPADVLDGREEDGEDASDDTPPGLKNGPVSASSGPNMAAGGSSGGVGGSSTAAGVMAASTGHGPSASSPLAAGMAASTAKEKLVVTTQAGYIMVLDLATLEVLAKVEPPVKESGDEVDPFVSVTYCSGTDRLCACTKGGELHFLQIGGVFDDIDDADIFVDGPLSKGVDQLFEGTKPSSNPSSPGITAGVDLLVDQALGVEVLSSLVELTRFETLTPRFSATVPPCWVEVQQEQQQRRHPQHLHQQHHGDAAQHTRTWKLQSDSSSWDEHVFELVLPKACMVGHVDFKFVMNANITNIPQIQVTLLKNKAPGLGKVNETAVDRQITFPLSQALHTNGERNGQPLLHDFTEDIQFMDIEESPGSRLCPFLEDHKEDILCGPVWLASGLDLSGHAGMLSLTSPKLVKGMAGGKYRSFLVHIKAVSDKGMEESPRPVVRMPSKPQSSKAQSLSSLLQRAQATKEKASTSKVEPPTASKKPDNLRGCDLLQEVSITIRRFKKTSIPKERIQRCSMLQFPEFHERLLNGLCKRTEETDSTEHGQSLILDILCWLAGVYSNGSCSPREGKEGLLIKTRKRLTDMVRVCFFQAGRSIAHKCARFLALCISNGKGDPGQQGFGMALLKALLENMPYLPAAATGGAVFWYFVLLNYVKDEDLAGCSTACASLLTAVSRQLQDRLTPLEALLQTRYGLYSSPFDPVLFDLEVSGSSCKNAFNSGIGVQSDEIDLSDILSGNGKVSNCAAAEGSFTALTGLLEVEPLHFTCVSTSDGTRVERDDASMFTVSTFGVTPAVGGLSAGSVGEASTALSSAAQVALQSLSHAMVSAEQQLQVLQEKQQQLLKLQQQKAKLEAKLHQTTSAAAAAAASGVGPIHNSVPSNPSASGSASASSAPGFFIHPSDVIPPTPKTTPLFMTPPLTPPNEAVSAAISVELAQLFPGSIMDPPAVNLAAHNKNSHKPKPVSHAQNPMGSGLALALSQASHFLQPPPHQSIIIERMHSGARRFVTLDFGRPVLLTDALIPTCADLASLSIDIWTLGEEVDGRRLVVATDIATHSLILHDLLPPPVCRFMKITVIGRYGSTNARAKIPLGFYYGHTYILPWESELKLMHDPLRGESEAASQPDVDQHLAMMVALQEDIQCRYNLACHRLETLLQSIDLPPLNSANNAQYFLRKPDKAVEEDQRVFSAYQDCVQLQLQLNLAHHAVQRLRVSLGASRKPLPDAAYASYAYDARELVHSSSTEQLRTVIRYLLDTLLSLLHTNNGHSVPSVLQSTFHAQACEELFKHLCISGTPKIRLHTGLLLVQLCGGERWWGQFLSNVLQELYNSEQLLIFPQDRVFMLLSCIGQRSLSNSGVLEGLLNLLDSLLSPLQQSHSLQARRTEGVLDIPMISWVVMLVSRLLDYVASVEDEASASKKQLGGKDRDRSFTGNQWSFINNSLQSQNMSRSTKGNSSLDRLYSRKVRKQLVHTKQQLNLLKAKQKALMEQIEKEKIQSNKSSSYKLLVEHAKLKQATSKHFKDLIRLRRTAEWPRSSLDTEASASGAAKEAPEVELLPFTLAHERCISVVQKLALFLLSMDFTCHADLLLFVCKVLARIANATRPTIHLCEVVSEQQLERLLLLLVGTDFNRGDISWGGAWAQYSLTCMLQDILAGELLSPASLDGMDEGASLGEEAGAAAAVAACAVASALAEPEEALAQPSPLPLVESIDETLPPDIIAGTPGTSSSSVFQSAPPLSSLEKDKDIDFDLLQDLMDVDIDPLDIDLEKDPLAAKVFKPIGSTWYDYWGADYGTYNYNAYVGGAGIPVSKPPAAQEKPGAQSLSVSVSQALDARLEVGLEQQAELMLKMMATLEADSILQALTSTSPAVVQSSNGTDDSLLRGLHGSSSPPGGSSSSSSLVVQPSSIPMLSACFNKLFSMLQVHHVQLESLLQLWLTLSLNSCPGSADDGGSDIFLFNASRVPTIPLNQASISSFLTVLAWYPNTSLRTWCLVLHSLTLMTNMPSSSASASSSGLGGHESTAQQMVSELTLVPVLVRFLSGSNPHGTSQHSSQVGPTATQAMQEFLTRLQVHLSSTCPQLFSEFLLELMHILSMERGPLLSGQGPLDAQVKLLEFTLEQSFETVSVGTIMAVVESITFLVHHYITCSDKVVSRSGSDSSVGARACFGGLFANIIRPGDAKAVCGETTRDQLMFNLLKLVNTLVKLPLTADGKFSGRVPPPGNGSSDSVSDEEKVCGSKEGPGQGGATPHQGPAVGVADLVLGNQQVMSQILSALGQCNSSAMAMIIGASGLHLTKHENFHGGLDAISVGDGLFTILTTLSKRATSVQVMLQPILTYMACGYMGRQGSLSTCQLSEPLLWFILRVLDTSEALKAFHDMGGVQLICNNMVTSTRAIVNTARSMVSTIMKFLDSGPGKAADGSLKARVLASEPDNAEGLHNFAPLGTITSSSPTAQPAEVLLQATPPHRRARSAAWSYIFLPEEAWCDLTIHLPAAVLLKEVHIQPHLASLATCPSSVSVEISADGVNMLPLSTPVITSGLTYIKIQLVKAEVASAVCLRLHRPRDASTLGLSQIKLLGLTAFGNTSSATVNNPFLPSEDQVSKTSIGWLRLLHHCLTHVSDLEAVMASAAAPTANLLQTCAALLMSPYCGMHSPNIEAVLVKIGLQSTAIGLRLIDILLRNCAASGTDPNNLNSPLLFGRLNGLSSDSTIDILYQLGTTQDPGTKDRVQALLQWVHDSARVAAMKRSAPLGYMGPSATSPREYGLLMPSPSHLHCVAAILWHSYELPVDYDLPALLNRELFELLYNWSMSLACNLVLKKAVDSLLCSMCHVHPSYFSLLMSWMGIVPSATVSAVAAMASAQSQARHRLSLTDDGKKQHDAAAATAAAANSASAGGGGASGGLTDDSKHARSPPPLSESQLATLAAASQSPGAIQQLLDSGLPSLLVRSLAALCCSLLASADLPLPGGATVPPTSTPASASAPSSSSSSSSPPSSSAASTSSSPAERRHHHLHHHQSQSHHHHHHSHHSHSSSSYHSMPSTSSSSSPPSSSSSSSFSCPPPPPPPPVNRATLSPELAAPVLRFLTEVGNSHAMKDWLGGPEVNPLWTALLFLLCHSSASAGTSATTSPTTNTTNNTTNTTNTNTATTSNGSTSNGQVAAAASASASASGMGASASSPCSSPLSTSPAGASAAAGPSSSMSGSSIAGPSTAPLLPPPPPPLAYSSSASASATAAAMGTSTAAASGSRYSLGSGGRAGGLTTQQRTSLENATVAFFLQCISCHPNNQRLMAQVLCELFQSAPQRGNVPISGNISGFIRRLFLQLMLEDEKVTVFLQSPCPLYKGRINATSHVIQHPMYGAGHKYRTLHLPISTTLADVLDRVSDTPSITAKLMSEQKEDKEKKNHEEKEKMKADNGFQDNYSVVVASGLKSQSKRALSTPPRPPSRRGRVMSDKLSASSGVDPAAKTVSVPVFHLYHKLLPGQPLPGEMTLAQLLTLLYDRKLPQGYRSIDMTVKLGSKLSSDPGLSKTDSFKRLRTEKEHGEMLSSCPEDEPMTPGDECLEAAIDESLLETNPIQSPLQVFAGMGGLALIAERLPMLYPDVIQQVSAPVVASSSQEKPKDSDQFEWVTIEQSGELVYEAPENIAAEPPPIKSPVQTMSPIPAHSLAAFGLFLRLPGYAEVLLKERKHAQCLLRLVLGVTDDGEGSHILQSPSANVLPTLPFHVLRALFSSTPLTTDDGLLLRRIALEIGAIHLILACLSALSHHAPRVPSTNGNQNEVVTGHGAGTSEEQQLYWAKGTGFGTGSTASGWDVEQALTKQRLEEEHVTCLLQVLASYINPAGCVGHGEAPSSESRGQNSAALPSVLQELLSQSCLIPAMSSYLRNDSVLDMARHVPLYRALLELLRAISSCTSLVPLLLPLSGDPAQEEEEEEERSESQTSVGMLLAKMKTCVDTYTNRLRSKKDKSKGVVKAEPSDPEPEGLTLLVPDIQRTAEIVYAATTSLRQANQEKKLAESSKKASTRPKPLSVLRSLEEKYVAAMKKLQFDTFEMVSEDEDGKLVFKVNYHYMTQVKNASDANSAARARRLAQEAVTLSTSLPLSSSSSVFVRCDEERLDIMKVLITGPADTPYANGCFEFDVYFPQDYPNSPPLVNLETTGGHSVRFNPNLYNDGKVCLSILNTWHGRPEEKWNPQTSSFLQVLVSVQSLILVSEPYFNEPGYERSRGTPSGTQSSREYDGNIRQASVKWAMLEQMRNPSPCFKEVIHKHFYLKRAEIMGQCEEWITDIQQYSSDKRVGRTMSHHAAALKRHTAQLREELLKLPCPEGLEPDGEDFSDKSSALLVKELPNQDAEKPGGSQDAHCSEGQL